MYWQNEKGSALLVVFMVTMVTFVLGSALLTVTTLEKKIATNHTDDMKALNIAEAGVEMAISELKKDAKWRTGYTQVPVGEGQLVKVTVNFVKREGSYTTLEVESTGKVRNSVRTIAVGVEIELLPLLDFGKGVTVGATTGEVLKITGSPEIRANFTYKGDIDLGSSNVRIIGYLYSEGNILNSGQVDVLDGKLWANGNITNSKNITGTVWAGGNVSNTGTITGTVLMPANRTYTGPLPTGGLTRGEVQKLEIPPMPALHPSWYQSVADVKYNSTTTLVLNTNTSLDNKIIFVNGNLTLSGNYRGKGTIVVTGDVDFPSDLRRQNTGDSIAIIGFGNMRNTGSAKILDALLLCDKNFTIQGGTTVNGALITRNLTINGGITLNYDASLNTDPPPGLPTSLKVVYLSYQE